MKVREIMTAEVTTAEPDTTLDDLAMMMRDEDVGSISILDDGELAGIVTDRDIVIGCIAEGKDPSEVTAEDIMSADLETVDGNADVEEASQIMARRQVRRLPVVEGGEFIGMVSLGDIAVKEDTDKAGDALENISQGVKEESGISRRKPSSAVRNQKEAKQDISNRNRREEEQRQSRVAPSNRQGKGGQRRKAG